MVGGVIDFVFGAASDPCGSDRSRFRPICAFDGSRVYFPRQQGPRPPGSCAHRAFPSAENRAPFGEPLLPAMRAPAFASFAHSEGLGRTVSGLDTP